MQTWFKRAPVYAGLTFSLTLGLVACGGNNTTPPPAVTNSVTKVSVALDAASIPVGSTTTAKATVTTTGTAAKTVTWSSSDDTVATVNSDGVVTALKEGTATITASSTFNGFQKGSADLTVTAAGTPVTPPPTGAVDAKIDFRKPGGNSVLPAGYVASTGQPYSDTLGYGWVTAASANATTAAGFVGQDMTVNARDRKPSATANTYTDPQYTFIIMKCPSLPDGTNGACSPPAVKTAGAFEYKVANGDYTVTVSAGDADTSSTNNQSLQTVNVEGKAVINATPNAANPFIEKTMTVNVADGFLTVDSGSTDLTKINYLLIKSVPATTTP